MRPPGVVTGNNASAASGGAVGPRGSAGRRPGPSRRCSRPLPAASLRPLVSNGFLGSTPRETGPALSPFTELRFIRPEVSMVVHFLAENVGC